MPATDAGLPAWSWRLAALIVAALVALPILVLFLQWFTLGNGEQMIWQHLVDTSLGRLAWNTLVLLLGVAIGVSVLGVSLAALMSLCEFPGRRALEWALLLPLAIPGYVMAFVFLGLFNYAGPAQTLARKWFGSSAWFPDVQSPLFVIVVLSLVLYPYVYLMARTAFSSQGRNLIDAACTLGLSPLAAFVKVVLPVARPAVAGGVALVLMETLADFGAVSVFNYDTFTTAMYKAWYSLFNPAVAAQLATLLLTFVLVTLVLEHYNRQGARYVRDERSRNRQRYRLTGMRAVAATVAATGVLLVAFVLPVVQLVLWVIEAGAAEYDEDYAEFLGHTLLLAAMASVLAVGLALLLSLAQRLPGSPLARRLQRAGTRIATLGYALPGSVLAVGIMQVFTSVSVFTGLALTGTVAA